MKIKKLVNKATAVIMAAVMTIGMVSATVLAADIKSIAPDKGNLYIHRYLIKDMADAGLPNDGTKAEVPESAEAVSEITFKVYKVNVAATAPSSGAVTVDSMVTTTKVTDADGKTFDVTLSETITTDSTGTASVADLAKGIYLVVEQENSKVAVSSAPYLVSVPMTNKDGDGWITDVHTYPKNSDLSITKEADKTSVKTGEVVTWTINATTGLMIEDSVKYDIIDELDTALDYVTGSLAVKGVSSDGTETVIQASDYTAKVNDSNVLIVSFNSDGRKTAVKYASVKIYFDTKVNEEILKTTAYTVENDASIEFINKYSQEKKRESNIVKIHSAAVKTVKTNTDGETLSGAAFKIATSEANAKAGNFLKKDLNGNIVDYGDDGYDTASDWEITTESDGTVLFEGISDYGTDGTYHAYHLVETKAPSGYSLAGVPIEAEFTAQNSTEATAYTININVVDDEIPTLPLTGGKGTWMYLLAGAVMIGVAFAMALRGTKKDKDKNKQ